MSKMWQTFNRTLNWADTNNELCWSILLEANQLGSFKCKISAIWQHLSPTKAALFKPVETLQWKGNRLYLGPVLPPTSWWSSMQMVKCLAKEGQAGSLWQLQTKLPFEQLVSVKLTLKVVWRGLWVLRTKRRRISWAGSGAGVRIQRSHHLPCTRSKIWSGKFELKVKFLSSPNYPLSYGWPLSRSFPCSNFLAWAWNPSRLDY